MCALSETKQTEITYYNLEFRGNTSTDIKERWKKKCSLRLPPDSENLVVCSFGVNDTVIENNELCVSLEQSIENTKSIMTEASKLYPVKMIGSSPIDDQEQNIRIETINMSFSYLCKELSIPYLSVFNDLKENSIWLAEITFNDRAHPREKGYSVLAQIVKLWKDWNV